MGGGHVSSTTPADWVARFVDDVYDHAGRRDLFRATSLLAAALLSGAPTGFSLILMDAAVSTWPPAKPNPFLYDTAHHMVRAVWSRRMPAAWRELHVRAQWQTEKPALLPTSSRLFSLDPRTPFRYAEQEGRQELFARVCLWRAAGEDAAPVSRPLRAEALRWVTLCTSYLAYTHVRDALSAGDEDADGTRPHTQSFSSSSASGVFSAAWWTRVSGGSRCTTVPSFPPAIVCVRWSCKRCYARMRILVRVMCRWRRCSNSSVIGWLGFTTSLTGPR